MLRPRHSSLCVVVNHLYNVMYVALYNTMQDHSTNILNVLQYTMIFHSLQNYGQEPPPATLESSDPGRDLASVYHLCCTYEKSLLLLVQKQVHHCILLYTIVYYKASTTVS